MVAHSLQLAMEELWKIKEPKISKLKWGLFGKCNATFNSWIKDINMCVQECKLSNLEAVQLIKDYTNDDMRSVVEFYLNTTPLWGYHVSTSEHHSKWVRALVCWLVIL